MVQSVEVYPLDIPSIWTTTKSITDTEETTHAPQSRQMVRITIYNGMYIYLHL